MLSFKNVLHCVSYDMDGAPACDFLINSLELTKLHMIVYLIVYNLRNGRSSQIP